MTFFPWIHSFVMGLLIRKIREVIVTCVKWLIQEAIIESDQPSQHDAVCRFSYGWCGNAEQRRDL